MDFYFTDRQYNLLGIASTERGRFRIAGEIEAQSTTASTVALTGNVYFAKDDLNDAINMVVGEGGNYILYEDDRGVGHFMTIQNTQVDNTGCSINFQADDAGNDLKNEIVGAHTATKAMTFAQYFAMFCADSGWELGLNEIPTNVRTLEFTSEQTSYDRMLEVANDFGVSLYYTFTIEGMTVVHRYLNVVNKLGSNTNVTLRQGTDISQIVSETSTADLHTSIKAYGSTTDGKTAPLNLVGYKWTDSTGQFVLGSDGVLRDTIAIRTWSRLRSNNNPTPESSHLQMVKTYDATTQATLLQSALADLKQYNHPAVNYTVTMARVPSELSKGDTVSVEDEAQNLYLSATVLEVDKCYSIPSNSTMILGDFKIEHDQTSAQIKQAAKTAEDAVSKATTAFSYAATVDDKADKAQATANTAQTTASTAQDTADTAQTTAASAVQVAEKAQASAYANRTFIKSATVPDTANLPVNAVWLQPADGATPASAKTWDGKTWQDTQIESSLIADNIVGKTITGSTFANESGTFSIDTDGTINGAMIVLTPSIQDGNTYEGAMTAADGVVYEVTKANGEQSFVAANWSSVQAQHVALDGTSTVAELDSDTGTVQVLNLDKDSNTVSSVVIDGESVTVLKDDSHMMMSLDSGLDVVHVNNDKSKDVYGIGPLGLQLQTISADNKVTSGVLDAWGLSRLNSIGTKLWSGAWGMGGTTTLTLSKPISDCLNGIVLLWGTGKTNAPGASDYTMTFIPKWFAADHSGRGIDCFVGNAGKNTFGIKYIYVTDTTLKGYANNGSNLAASKVLQGVYEY